MLARGFCGWVLAVVSAAGAAAQSAKPVQGGMSVCRRAVFEGEVEYGKAFIQPIGSGLTWMLEPIASGWIVRVLPANGPRGQHDYAELATPPYQTPPYFSVSPLLVGTDFSFRAQDAVGWNPRRFRYAASRRDFERLSASYEQYRRSATPAVQQALAELVERAPEGELRILDAHLIPGQADQAPTAATVASHFTTTAHTVEQPDGKESTELGRITWMRFRVQLDTAAGFVPAHGLHIESYACVR